MDKNDKYYHYLLPTFYWYYQEIQSPQIES